MAVILVVILFVSQMVSLISSHSLKFPHVMGWTWNSGHFVVYSGSGKFNPMISRMSRERDQTRYWHSITLRRQMIPYYLSKDLKATRIYLIRV